MPAWDITALQIVRGKKSVARRCVQFADNKIILKNNDIEN